MEDVLDFAYILMETCINWLNNIRYVGHVTNDLKHGNG